MLGRLNSGTETPASVVGVLDELYSAKSAQLSSHTGPPGSSLYILAGLYGYSAERG